MVSLWTFIVALCIGLMISSVPERNTPIASAYSSAEPLVAKHDTQPGHSFDIAAMEQSFAELQNTLNGPAGIAIASNGEVWTTGTKQTDYAWSISKVPVAIAALTANKSERNLVRARSAITISSNSAAHALWETLGGEQESASAVTEVLVAGGDSNTVVNYDDNNFGLTDWTVTDSAVFADHIPCMPEAKNVYALMGAINKSHHWGLGVIPGTHFKGGWGPVDSGFIVRQMGVIQKADNSFFGVSIMVDSKRGQIRGQQDLTAIAHWLKKYIAQVPSHTC